MKRGRERDGERDREVKGRERRERGRKVKVRERRGREVERWESVCVTVGLRGGVCGVCVRVCVCVSVWVVRVCTTLVSHPHGASQCEAHCHKSPRSITASEVTARPCHLRRKDPYFWRLNHLTIIPLPTEQPAGYSCIRYTPTLDNNRYTLPDTFDHEESERYCQGPART